MASKRRAKAKGKPEPVRPRKPGRQSKFDQPQNNVQLIQRMCEVGLTDHEISKSLGIDPATLWRWCEAHPKLRKTIKAAKQIADDRVERSLYHKAIGYSYEAEKIFCDKGKIVRTPYIAHVPPSDVACIFWLKNRQPDLWRDRIEHVDPEGNEILLRLIDMTGAKKS